MGIFHFLNVLEGDCSVIQHPSGHVTVIDVNNAFLEKDLNLQKEIHKAVVEALRVRGDFNQKSHPVNPVTYLKSFEITSVFRFILTHPDMDHMGGIEAFFKVFDPVNFWDTDNNKEIVFEPGSPYSEDDWLFYKSLRDSHSGSSPKRLSLYSGARGKYFNESEDGSSGGDGLYILAPTEDLIAAANKTGDFNDASYVILYRAVGGRILLGGDAHDRTWEYILDEHQEDVANVDLFIAPHHGRKSARSYDFLDIVNPRLTFFGNARSEHLAYDAWRSRGLSYVTNNQANCMVVDADVHPVRLYVTNEAFAKHLNRFAFLDEKLKAYYCYEIA